MVVGTCPPPSGQTMSLTTPVKDHIGHGILPPSPPTSAPPPTPDALDEDDDGRRADNAAVSAASSMLSTSEDDFKDALIREVDRQV